MNIVKIVIKGVFPGLNEFIDANRRRQGRWSGGNEMKKKDQNRIVWQLPRWHTDDPVYIKYTFFCPDRRKDKDNISGYFHKVFQDALVQKGCIPNDGWQNIIGFQDEFYTDRKNPRIEIEITESKV